jgi:hypothetical protein
MRKFLLLTVALVALAGQAVAADLNLTPLVKAKPNVYPTTRCGLFYGLAMEGTNGIVNGAPAGTVQIGGDIGGVVGWACPMASIPYFVQVKGEFQNLNAGNAGFAMKGPAHFEEMAAVQTPLLQWFANVINVGQGNVPPLVPLLPPGVTPTGTPQNYVGIVLDQDDISTSFGNASNHNWINSWGVRTGLLTNLLGPNATSAVADTFVQLNFKSQPFGCVGPSNGLACPKFGDVIRVGLEVKM